MTASLVLALLGLLLGPSPVPPTAGLVDGIEAPLARPELKGADVAVLVIDVESGQRVYSRNADRPLAPASNMKLVTSGAALSLFGGESSLETRFCSGSPPTADGTLAGDLVVRGGADPCLRADLLAHAGVSDPADALVDVLLAGGVHRVAGRLVLDDGLLDRTWVHPDWKPGDVAAEHGAPIGALSIHGNCVQVAVEGRRVSWLHEVAGYRLANELKAADKSSAFAVWVMPPDDDGVVRVRGEVGRSVGRQEVASPVIDPTDHFGRCLAAALARRGVVVEGGMSIEAGAAARAPHVLGSLRTPLANAVLIALKESDNTITEHLYKRLGAAYGGEGSFEGGARAVTGWLQTAVGTPLDGVVLRDGSGLSARNRVTARLLVDVLVTMARSQGTVRDTFLRALPVSGSDGSLRDRMREESMRGAVRAKTGYIASCSSLSGYARTASGRTLAFSILINGFPAGSTNAQMKDIQDDICRALVARS